MIITALVENTTLREDLGTEHGLSLFIETEKHKLLFDTGASSLFAENAVKLGIDLSTVDLVILSHGHYDHGGGLPKFLSINHRASVYLHQQADGHFFSRGRDGTLRYIGLDRTLLAEPRLVFAEDREVINHELSLFAHVTGRSHVPSGNRHLLRQAGQDHIPDDFRHEQNLIIQEEGKEVLIAGCAHRGILNILDAFKQERGRMPDVVIGGFHLYHHSQKTSEDPRVIDEIARGLLESGAMFYTGHCTGEAAYHQMKKIMGDRIDYLSTGRQILL